MSNKGRMYIMLNDVMLSKMYKSTDCCLLGTSSPAKEGSPFVQGTLNKRLLILPLCVVIGLLRRANGQTVIYGQQVNENNVFYLKVNKQ